jgi:hypothetical protein
VCDKETSWYEETIARAGLQIQRKKQTNVMVELFVNTNHMCHTVMTATIWEAISMERTMLVGAFRNYVWSDVGNNEHV